MPACQDAVGRAHRPEFPACHVSNLNFLRRGQFSYMLHAHDRAVQPDAHWRGSVVQRGVACFCGDYIADRIAGNGFRDKLSHDQACDAGVSVREVEEILFGFFVGNGVPVHPLAGCRIEVQSGETWQFKSPRILGWNSVDANPKERMRKRLV